MSSRQFRNSGPEEGLQVFHWKLPHVPAAQPLHLRTPPRLALKPGGAAPRAIAADPGWTLLSLHQEGARKDTTRPQDPSAARSSITCAAVSSCQDCLVCGYTFAGAFTPVSFHIRKFSIKHGASCESVSRLFSITRVHLRSSGPSCNSNNCSACSRTFTSHLWWCSRTVAPWLSGWLVCTLSVASRSTPQARARDRALQ
jgi:hypothetical protein